MNESAADARVRRKAASANAVTRIARRMTAFHGFSGFTVDELAAEAGISRRTFFNYFASKEDAVIGVTLESTDAEAVSWFLAARGEGTGISANLLNDLADLAARRWRALDHDAESVADLLAAADREPRLVRRLLDMAIEGERRDASLIERREALDPGDLRAEVAAQIVGALVRSTTADFLKPGNPIPFLDLFQRRLDVARELLATQNTLIGLA